MGLIYAKNLKHAKKKVYDQLRKAGDTKKQAKKYKVSLSKFKSEEKGYKLYYVRYYGSK